MATKAPARRSRSPARPKKAATASRKRSASRTRAVKHETREVVSSNEPWTLRRWEAGETNRLNRAHWEKATGQTINADLAGNLKTLRARCAHEASNNPIVEGMIHSHATDIVGRDGPTLDVLSDDEEFNEAVESLWRDWWNPGPLSGLPKPDAAGLLSGPDLLRQDVWLWWTKGEHVHQLTNDDESPRDQVSLRFQAIDPDRLDTDPQYAGDARVALGVRRTKAGRPVQYYIADLVEHGPFSMLGYDYTAYPSDEIIHQFEAVEPGQVRGIPWLASSLQTIAELRDYDKQVLDAARAAAALGVVWWTIHPDAQYYEINETTDVERNKQWTGPPGWQPTLIDPKQPAAQYVEFRTERLRELGRARSIPLMKILLGSERHNFASARMDNQNYQRACEAIQSWTERLTLNRLLATFLRELILLTRNGRFVLPPRPEKIPVVWHWPTQPHVDPLKEANAQRIRLETGTLSFAAACAADGTDEDRVIASRARSAKKLANAGLPPVPTAQPPIAQPVAAPRPQDDGVDEDALDEAGAPDEEAIADNG